MSQSNSLLAYLVLGLLAYQRCYFVDAFSPTLDLSASIKVGRRSSNADSRPVAPISKSTNRCVSLDNRSDLQRHQKYESIALHASKFIDDSERRREGAGILRRVLRSASKGIVPRRRLQRSLRASALGIAGILAFTTGIFFAPHTKHAARASAPVMALPKAEGRDPASEALLEHERRMIKKAQEDINVMTAKAQRIEAEQGVAARARFEKEYKEQQEQHARDKAVALEKLKRDLLDQGIDPFTDMEGQRQITLLEKGIDLGEVSGTPFYLEKEFETRNPKKSMKVKKAANRQVLACMVQDLKNRDIDPLTYFEQHQDQTMKVMDLPVAQAAALLQHYQANLDAYGQIKAPQPGEMSAKERMAAAPKDPKAAKAEARRLKEEANAKAKAEKERIRAEAKALKEDKQKANKAEAKARREQKQRAKEAAKEEAKRAKEETKALAAAGIDGTDSAVSENTETDAQLMDESIDQDFREEKESSMATSKPPSSALSSSKKIPIVPLSAVLIAGGGGAYGIKLYREKAARDEEERQRQFRLLMGDTKSQIRDELPIVNDLNEEEIDGGATKSNLASPSATGEAETESAAPAPQKKRRLGIFNKKKSERETDLMELVGPDAKAPELASTLAKLLTFGAPGRFPDVASLPGGMPMNEFDLDLAKQLLVEARISAQLELDESAEIFANVVNCMLIEIVDLASSSLKEKDSKVTVDAINIVVEFMNHAASLYDAVAEGASIKPVTYSGTLSKSKLEQMYSAYAVSGMMNMKDIPEDFDSRVGLLQDVFEINEKKAEGLMMKAMQKRMMEMMKNGEGMEEMLQGMGGMEGMEGLLGEDGEGPSTEQLKTMLLELKRSKDAGEISKEDLVSIKSMFKENFGMSMDDLSDATADDEEREVLELMKSILDD